MTDRKYVGVIGAGSFGTAIANLLAYNVEVLIYSRNAEIVEIINTQHQHMGLALNERIQATSDLKFLAEHCTLLFPVVPSANFREMMQ
ncbi:MAG: NAD(P)-binding domain-containing protein, partial [Bacteroidota bacterium]